MNQKPAVAVTVLCGLERDSWINPVLMMKVIQSIYEGSQAQRSVAVGLKFGVSPVETARNQAVQEFLSGSCSWLIMLDNDCVPPSNFLKLIDLAEAESKLVFGIPCPMNGTGGPTWNIGVRSNDGLRCGRYSTLPRGWNRCDFMGAAFLAIHRSVLVALKKDWFNRNLTDSEDFSFCERVIKGGYQVWFHGDYQCDHIHSISLLDVLNQQNQLTKQQAAS
jgi:hypothetical protein